MNKVFLIGNLTKDPEVSMTGSGIALCKFTLAVQRTFTNSDGAREADFLPVIAWRQLGESCGKFLKKGSKACVVGNIQTRSYDGNDGQKRYVTEIIASDVEFLTPKTDDFSADNEDQRPVKKSKPTLELIPDSDDDLPF